jgi:hypothetical protein
MYDTKCSALILQQVVHIIILEAEFNVRSGLVRWVGGVRSFYIYTYLFIPLIQSLHQLRLNMEDVNKHQTTQDTQKNTVTR